jgi:outer membrane receptor protein involved in Fe transport
MNMRKHFTLLFLSILVSISTIAQHTVEGVIKNENSGEPIKGAVVLLEGTEYEGLSDETGQFSLQNIPTGTYVLIVSAENYFTFRLDLTVELKDVLMGEINLTPDINTGEDVIIELSNEDLISSDEDLQANISGILHGSRDVFLSTAGFTFGPLRYRLRGYDNKYVSLHMNGIQTNDLESGRAIWGYWGGLNDAVRNNVTFKGIAETDYTFGGIGGSTNINTRASHIRKGLKLTYSFSNRSYHHRGMFLYNTGLMENGWAFAFSGSRRFAEEGFSEGTSYDAYAYFASIEKKLNDQHSLGLVVFGAPSKRGSNSATTQEVYDLTNTQYNPNWGWQDGKKRNARITDGHTPFAIFTHYWDINKSSKLQTNLAYSKGKYNRTSLNWYDAADPRPDYYRYLPSYFQDGDGTITDSASYFMRMEEFQNGDRQINWDAMYQTNYSNPDSIFDADGIVGNTVIGNRSQYIIEDRRNENDQFWFNTVYNNRLNDNLKISVGLQHRYLKGRQYKALVDLLGGDFVVDIDKYAERDLIGEGISDNDLQIPNRIIDEEGEVFGYDYNSTINYTDLWAQLSADYNKLSFYLTANGSYTMFYRTGNMQNGKFPNNSLGDSEKLSFTNYGIKAGATYKLSGKHFLHAGGAYLTKAPDFRNSFVSPRTRNQTVTELTSETIYTAQGGYVIQASKIKATLDVFYTQFNNQTEARSYYFDRSRAFLNFVMTGIDKTHQGVELGLEYTFLPGLSVFGVGSVGYYRWSSRPNFSIYVDNGSAIPLDFENDVVYVKGNLVDGTPQTAYSGGLKYFAPKFWWIGLSANYLDDRYLAFSALTRAAASLKYFTEDQLDDQRYIDFIAQDKLPSSFTLDAFLGKSFRFDYKYYLSISLNVTNILDNRDIITGGYEQARFVEGNDLERLGDFPPKLYYASGMQYFLNINFRF